MEILRDEGIFLQENIESKDECLRKLAGISVDLSISNSKEDVYRAYLERESVGSTGMENGFSIPHAKAKSIKSPQIIFIRNDYKIKDWETLDGSFVDIIISFLIPEENSEEHLKLLAKVSMKLMREENIKRLRETNSKEEIREILLG